MPWIFKPRPPTPTGEPPWRQRPDWAAGRIVSSGKAGALMMLGFAGFWNAIAIPAAFMIVPAGLRDGHQAAWWVLIFPVVGVGLLALAVRAVIVWRKFGQSVFEMAAVPGVIGGTLEGTIRLQTPLRPVDGFWLKLSCLNRVTSGSGDDRSTREQVVWQDEETVTTGFGDLIPVAFYIPADCRGTDGTQPNNSLLWRLEAAADVPGIKYAVQFEVPVFKVAQTPAQLAAAGRVRDKEQAEIAAYQLPAALRIRVTPTGRGGREFDFPAARNPGVALGLTMFLALWTGSIGLAIWFKAPLLFPVVFGLFELLIGYFVLQLWFAAARVVVDRNGIQVTRRWLGVTRTSFIPVTDVAAIRTKPGMTAGTTVYHDLQVLRTNGRTITVATAVRDTRAAQWLAAEMTRAGK